MTIRAPNSEQKESMEVLFRVRTQHKDNFMEWLSDCREAAVQNVMASRSTDDIARSVGELTAIENIHKILSKF